MTNGSWVGIDVGGRKSNVSERLFAFCGLAELTEAFLINQNKICFLLVLQVEATQHNTGLMVGRADHTNPYILVIVFLISFFFYEFN